jgi:hypothetical protein
VTVKQSSAGARVRRAGDIALGIGWAVLAIVYSLPLLISMSGSMSVDVWVESDAPGHEWVAFAYLGIALLAPPVALGLVTRYWLRRRREV